jgi:hypothetical protein
MPRLSPLFLSMSLSLCAGLAALSGCSKARPAAVPTDEAQRLLLDRNWLDRVPQTPRDRLHVFRFVPAMGGGVYQDRTLFAGTFELFSFDHDGERIRFHLHHTGEEASARYTIERMAGDGPYDLHLHITDSPRGPHDYYSLRGMQARTAARSAAGSDELEAELRSLFASPRR